MKGGNYLSAWSILVLIHITGAVCGLGAAFAIPALLKRVQNVPQGLFTLQVVDSINKLAKYGSIVILISGLIMGFINTSLFTQIWYIASLVIYVLIQPIVNYLLPKNTKQQKELLESANDGTLPAAYALLAKQAMPLHTLTYVATFLLIILMVFKP